MRDEILRHKIQKLLREDPDFMFNIMRKKPRERVS